MPRCFLRYDLFLAYSFFFQDLLLTFLQFSLKQFFCFLIRGFQGTIASQLRQEIVGVITIIHQGSKDNRFFQNSPKKLEYHLGMKICDDTGGIIFCRWVVPVYSFVKFLKKYLAHAYPSKCSLNGLCDIILISNGPKIL